MAKIEGIFGRQVFDSRGNPTIEVDLFTEHGLFRSMVPSGASTGSFEAVELRDGKKEEFNGKSVMKAVVNVNTILANKLKGMNIEQQTEIDSFMNELDGTSNKARLGANAILAISMSVCKAGAASKEIPLHEYIGELSGNNKFQLPVSQFNVMNGGKHAGLENDIQEHMLMPTGFKNYSDSLKAGIESYHVLKSLLKKKFGARATLLGDEGGFVPPIETTNERLDFALKAIDEAGYGGKIKLALDCAASEFYYKEKNNYNLWGKELSSGELIDYYSDLIKTYPIVSIEDGFHEEDWSAWSEFTSKLGKKLQIVGDDLLVTNPERVQKAINEKSCNSLLLKFNQIGTVTEAINSANLAFENNWNVVVSHRSGETEDSFIADAVVGLKSNQSKFGAPARSERNAKYNQLLRIEELVGKGNFAGKNFK